MQSSPTTNFQLQLRQLDSLNQASVDNNGSQKSIENNRDTVGEDCNGGSPIASKNDIEQFALYSFIKRASNL